MTKPQLTYEFEDVFREIEGVKIVVRQGRNEPVTTPYAYQKKLAGTSTISKLRERVEATLGPDVEYDLLDAHMNPLHGLTKLVNAREAQKATLPE